MKAIVETTLVNKNLPILKLFAKIIEAITQAESENNLRVRLGYLKHNQPHFEQYFIYGFGAHHLWLKEKGNNERLIFVEF